MIHLVSLPVHQRAMLPALAVATGAPLSFLSKVLQALAAAELISSRRGKSGGFAILPQGRKASMYDVIAAIDGPICLNVCLIAGKSCARKVTCPSHPVWARAQRAMLEVLVNASIADLGAQALKRGQATPQATAASAAIEERADSGDLAHQSVA